MLRRGKEIRAVPALMYTYTGRNPGKNTEPNMLLRTQMLPHSGDILNAFVNPLSPPVHASIFIPCPFTLLLPPRLSSLNDYLSPFFPYLGSVAATVKYAYDR